MNWLQKLFTDHSIEQTLVVYAVVIAIGVMLGRLKLFGISVGITWILFVGLLASYIGLTVDPTLQHFLRDFGLILFVYSIGLQVGPGFFASLKKNALSNNLFAASVVGVTVIVTSIFYLVSNYHIGIMAGVMSGGVTNTPGLGAAQATLTDLRVTSVDLSMVTLAYAVAYPFGVFGTIASLLIIKKLFRVNIQHEEKLHQRLGRLRSNQIVAVHLNLENRHLAGETVKTLHNMLSSPITVTRILRDEKVFTPSIDTTLAQNDVLLIVTPKRLLKQLYIIVGGPSDADLKKIPHSELADSLVVVTNAHVTHRRIGDIPEFRHHDYTMSRIMRAGIEIIPDGNVTLQLGDTVKIVGTLAAIQRMTKVLGNSVKSLEAPDLAPIFMGIVLGILLGSIPILLPGMPVAVKIGLAGGPLIVALLLSRFGNIIYLNNYTTSSANLMMRELGITLFLASIGLGSGHNLAQAFEGGRGWAWMAMGFCIATVPLITVGVIAMKYFRKTYFEMCGVLAGASTDPPGLAFSLKMTGSDIPSTSYATVYPLAMILRIVAAQAIILAFV